MIKRKLQRLAAMTFRRRAVKPVINVGLSLMSFILKRPIPWGLPVKLMIEPTNICNLKCPTCPTGRGDLGRPGGYMEYEKFRAIIDEVGDWLYFIILYNYGEPFLHKEFLRMVRYAGDKGVLVETSTNGHFFKSPEYCHEIIESGLYKMIISLDGASQETLEVFRVGSHFNKIIEGMRWLSQAKKEVNSKLPIIELQFIAMKHNQHEIGKMQKLADDIGVDIFSIKTPGIEMGDEEFSVLNPDEEFSRSSGAKGEEGLKGDIPNRCSWIYTNMTINVDGAAVPCCYDLYTKHSMGNVFEEGVRSVWKNRRYAAFRKALHKNRAALEMCKTCPEFRHDLYK
jgi:radical SAM protein with 4Fe4S-binding SPASM domain